MKTSLLSYRSFVWDNFAVRCLFRTCSAIELHPYSFTVYNLTKLLRGKNGNGDLFSSPSFHRFFFWRYFQILISAGRERVKRNSWMWKQTPSLLWGQRYDIPSQSAAQNVDPFSLIVDSPGETQHGVAALNNAEIPGQWQRHPRRHVSVSLRDLGPLWCCFPVAQKRYTF